MKVLAKRGGNCAGNMRKMLMASLALVGAVLLTPTQALATTLVTVTGDTVRVNVLGTAEGVEEIKEATRTSLARAKTLLLSLEDDSQRLTLGDYTMDVSAVTSDLVTIEDTDIDRVMTVKNQGTGYRISQGGLNVGVAYPVIIDVATHKLTVGSQVVGVSPMDVAKTILRAKYATNILGGEIIEEGGVLYYQINGEKHFSWGNVWKYNLPVSVKLSATDGEVVEFKAPYWYKLLRSFLV